MRAPNPIPRLPLRNIQVRPLCLLKILLPLRTMIVLAEKNKSHLLQQVNDVEKKKNPLFRKKSPFFRRKKLMLLRYIIIINDS